MMEYMTQGRRTIHLSAGKGDQVIREDPAGAVVVRAWPRGTETSAEVLVGPPLGAGGWS
jgi:hypothetical protein